VGSRVPLPFTSFLDEGMGLQKILRKIVQRAFLFGHGKHLIYTQVISSTYRESKGETSQVREGVGAGGRNEPSLVCTYE
jgi:hypothetical protein